MPRVLPSPYLYRLSAIIINIAPLQDHVDDGSNGRDNSRDTFLACVNSRARMKIAG
jgi:hypothetical protein